MTKVLNTEEAAPARSHPGRRASTGRATIGRLQPLDSHFPRFFSSSVKTAASFPFFQAGCSRRVPTESPPPPLLVANLRPTAARRQIRSRAARLENDVLLGVGRCPATSAVSCVRDSSKTGRRTRCAARRGRKKQGVIIMDHLRSAAKVPK